MLKNLPSNSLSNIRRSRRTQHWHWSTASMMLLMKISLWLENTSSTWTMWKMLPIQPTSSGRTDIGLNVPYSAGRLSYSPSACCSWLEVSSFFWLLLEAKLLSLRHSLPRIVSTSDNSMANSWRCTHTRICNSWRILTTKDLRPRELCNATVLHRKVPLQH